MDEDLLGLVTVFTDTDRIRVEMVKTILLAEGIFFQVEGAGLTGLTGIQPEFLGITEIKIQVRERDAARTREILSKEINGYGKDRFTKES